MISSLTQISRRQAIMGVLISTGLGLIGLRIYSGLTGLPPDPTLNMDKELVGVMLPSPRELQPFTLTDHNMQPFTPKRLQGKWTIAFFGYTHCPDVCPVSMGLLAEAFSILEKRPKAIQGVQGVFITVDTERDTPELLKAYVPYFHPDFLGVTGTQDAIHAFAKQVGAYYALPPKSDNKDESQLISHSSVFFLFDPQGRFTALFQPQLHQPAIMAELFIKIRQHYGESI
ncbi:MAG: SCO family protein [Magnetococcales bacterium]|nr:SCO family protein [Magnetococcales bacterium]NGZ05396.1 SCO family protein [Magnetococcales bacterium]